MFIAETWTDEARLVLVLVQEKIKFKNKFIAARRNKAGGLVIFWKEDFDLTIETFSKNHIDTTVNKNKAKEWRFTGFYGEPDAQNRHEAWARLKNLKSRGSTPWICEGDFNEITKQQEYWRSLVPSPTRTNKSLILELSGVWELTNRKLARGYGVGKRSLRCVYSRNMDGRNKTSSSSRKNKV